MLEVVEHDGIRLSLDPRGAYIDSLTFEGRNLLFPRTVFKDGKVRGGMHVCLPNFGPDYTDTLKQHGFGRTVEWQVSTVRSQPGKVRCSFTAEQPTGGVSKAYLGLQSRLTYKIAYDVGANTASLDAELTVLNRGHQSMLIAPGFHPYFATPLIDTPADVRLIVDPSGSEYSFPEATWLGSPMIDLGSNRSVIVDIHDAPQVVIVPRGLPMVVCWSDGRVGDSKNEGYVCVEPTLNGYGFASQVPRGDELAVGAGKTYGMHITWNL